MPTCLGAALKRTFNAVFTGKRPFDSNDSSKSHTRTLCSTSGCLTTTITVVLATVGKRLV